MSIDSWRLTRRAALKGLVATGAGLLVGRVGYGVIYERHQIRSASGPSCASSDCRRRSTACASA